MKTDDIMAAVMIGVAFSVIFFIIGNKVGIDMNNSIWEKDVIQRGYGLYCPNTGEFAWKGECDE